MTLTQNARLHPFRLGTGARHLRRLLLASISALLSACGATTSTLAPTTNAARGGALSGPVVRDTVVPFATQLPQAAAGGRDVDLSGELQDRVVRLDADGTLVVAPRLRNMTVTIFENTITVVDDITLTGFAGVDVEIFYRTDGLGEVAPATFTRSADGDSLTFTFDIDEEANTLASYPVLSEDRDFRDTYVLSINTNATAFGTNGTVTIRGYVQSFNGRSDLDLTLTETAAPVAP